MRIILIQTTRATTTLRRKTYSTSRKKKIEAEKMGEKADQLGHPGFPGLSLYQCFEAGKLSCVVSTMAERYMDIQEVVRRVVANLHMPPVSAAQSNPPTNSQSTSISEELNHAFQITRGPVQQPSALGESPGNCTYSDISQLAAGFSNTHNYGARSSGQRRGRQESLNRRTSGRFYTVRNEDVCLLPSPSWNKVPRGGMKAFQINRGIYVDAWPVLKDWNEATLTREIQRLFSSFLKDASGQEIGWVAFLRKGI